MRWIGLSPYEKLLEKLINARKCKGVGKVTAVARYSEEIILEQAIMKAMALKREPRLIMLSSHKGHISVIFDALLNIHVKATPKIAKHSDRSAIKQDQ